MRPLRRGQEPTVREVEEFLEETYPGCDAATRLHALVFCWVYVQVFRERRGREAVAERAGRRGVTPRRLSQIIAGDFAGASWAALEAVLIACDAAPADIQVAQRLYDRSAAGPPCSTGGTPGRGEIPRPPASAAPVPTDLPCTSQPHHGEGRHGRAPDGDAHRDAAPPGPPPPAPDDTEEETATIDAGPPARSDAAALRQLPGDGDPHDGAVDHQPRAGRPSAVHEPDPMTATTVEEFVALLKQFRLYKVGERPLREMVKAAQRHPMVDRPYSFSSLSTIGRNGKLPKRALLRAYIAGADGTAKDIERWERAHGRLSILLARSNGPLP